MAVDFSNVPGDCPIMCGKCKAHGSPGDSSSQPLQLNSCQVMEQVIVEIMEETMVGIVVETMVETMEETMVETMEETTEEIMVEVMVEVKYCDCHNSISNTLWPDNLYFSKVILFLFHFFFPACKDSPHCANPAIFEDWMCIEFKTLAYIDNVPNDSKHYTGPGLCPKSCNTC